VTSGEQTSKKRKSSASEVASIATGRPRRNSTKKPKVPTLRMGLTGSVSRDQCGGFRRRRNWTVDNPRAGLIVQHVERKFENVERWDSVGSTWIPMSDADIDAYVTASEPYATVAEYWEAWEVNDSGRVSNGNEDSFASCSIIPDAVTIIGTTRGTFTITGEAKFYPTETSAADAGFTGTVGPAGEIANSATDPDLAGQGITPTGAMVGYGIKATWNSRRTDVYTKVEEFTFE